jgi:alkaline phosphatase D
LPTGDGSNLGPAWEATRADNPHIRYNSNRRGYVPCTATAARMRTDFMILDRVTVPDLPARAGGSLIVEAGRPVSNTD